MSASAHQLSALIDALGSSTKKRDLTKIGVTLAAIAGRAQPYSYKYVHAVMSGKLKAGKAFRVAIDQWLESVDGRLKIGHAGYDLTEVYGREDHAYAQVDGRIELCANSECGIRFLTDHPNRKFCKICHPPVS